jgi:chromosome segregation ATPase
MEELKKAIETATATVNAKQEAVQAASEKVNTCKEAVASSELAMFDNPGKKAVEEFKKAKEELATAETELATAQQELANAEKELTTAQQELANAIPNSAKQLVNVASAVSTKELVKILLASHRANRGTAVSVALAMQTPERYTTPEALKLMIQDVNAFMHIHAPNNGEAIQGNCSDHNTIRGAITLAGLLAGLQAVSEETFTAKLTKE